MKYTSNATFRALDGEDSRSIRYLRWDLRTALPAPMILGNA